MRSIEEFMRLAIEQAELARGKTGDNPWVGCVIVGQQAQILGAGHTRGPGEHHAEISAAADAAARGHSIVGATLYSTLEPCSFHGRTPACARAIVSRGLTRVIIGIRDPNPKVDGAGIQILKSGGIDVLEGVCEREVAQQLGGWILEYHPAALKAEALRLAEPDLGQRATVLAQKYGIDRAAVARLIV